MRKIITIGGGKIKNLQTLKIDKEIVRLSGKEHPKALFIPTASSDSEDYWGIFQKVYGKKLGCKTDVLYLLNEKPTKKQIKKKILCSDLIYVGGGNTLKMMRLWRRIGVDKVLKAAYRKGVVLCGISAGSICWFESGHSDSMSFYKPKKWKYINVKGLGLIKGIHCPHYNSSTRGIKRKKNFQKMIKKNGGFGIAIDNNCAIEFVDNKYRVITSKKHAKAYKVYKQNGKIVSKEIKQEKKLMPTGNLYKRNSG